MNEKCLQTAQRSRREVANDCGNNDDDDDDDDDADDADDGDEGLGLSSSLRSYSPPSSLSSAPWRQVKAIFIVDYR